MSDVWFAPDPREPLDLWLDERPPPAGLPDVRQQRFEFSSRGDRVPGRLLLPPGKVGPFPLVLLQHGAGGSKEAPYLDAAAGPWVRAGAAVASIDFPLHGERANVKLPVALLRGIAGAAPLLPGENVRTGLIRRAIVDLRATRRAGVASSSRSRARDVRRFQPGRDPRRDLLRRGCAAAAAAPRSEGGLGPRTSTRSVHRTHRARPLLFVNAERDGVILTRHQALFDAAGHRSRSHGSTESRGPAASPQDSGFLLPAARALNRQEPCARVRAALQGERMDRRLRFAFTAVSAVGFSLACTPRDATPQAAKGPASADASVVVAEIAGTPVTSGELDAWIREDLFQRETTNKGKAELFEFKNDALERMLDEKVLAAEAAKQKLSADELLAKEAQASGAVSEDAVKAFYEQNKARMGSSTFEQIAPRIRRFLEERQLGETQAKYVAGLREKAGVTNKLETPRIAVATEGPSLGKADAPVTIVEFSDYQCPFCKRAEPIVQEVLKKYPDQVRFVFRHFPSIRSTRAPALPPASCANGGRFWQFHEKVFAGDGLEEADLEAYGQAAGVDAEKFKTCVAERRFQDQVEADAAAGREAGVSGTPAFFVNGIMLSGAKPVEEFSAVIDRELAGPKKGS
jgi:protein-disulfide isomerase